MKKGPFQSLMPIKRRWLLVAALLLVLVGLGAAGLCVPQVRRLASDSLAAFRHGREAPDGHDHANCDGHEDEDHDHAEVPAKSGDNGKSEHAHEGAPETADAHEGHDHEGEAGHGEEAADHKHDETAAVKLSATAQENVGLRLAKVEIRPFERTVTVPGIIVERPGRTNTQVAAPLTGVITRVWPMQGEAVTTGQPLFDLRLTHEEVVESQAEFLKTTEELDVLQREIARLEKVTAEGAVAGKTLLERKYEQQKLQAVLRSQRQKLLLHGLTAPQIEDILAKRTLLSSLTISAPEPIDHAPGESSTKNGHAHVLQVQDLKVEKGQHVKAGEALCLLADHSELFIQGKAFEQDAKVLDKAAGNEWPVAAVIHASGQQRERVSNLPLLYIANKIDPESRAVLFYVQLPNKVIRTHQTADGHRFSAWQFKPGQRVDLMVPVERWPDRIVLPAGAVVQDGPEAYVFEKNGSHFDRRSVCVEYRDQDSVVIATDGNLSPGKMVISSSSAAYQVHLAMKNKAGGAPDPHAGHNH
jgi:multidrug efflux pump subunit AcrA (membrane-fusion protein)